MLDILIETQHSIRFGRGSGFGYSNVRIFQLTNLHILIGGMITVVLIICHWLMRDSSLVEFSTRLFTSKKG